MLAVLLSLAVVALAVAVGFRWATRAPTGPVEVVAMSLVGTIAIMCTAGSLLAVAGALRPLPILTVLCGVALIVVPWRRRGEVDTLRRPGRTEAWVLVGLLLAGVALRWPPMSSPLAGRDQGTYQLRADALQRTGQIPWVNEVLARAHRDAQTRPGAADVAGLYGADGRPGHADLYEGSYRAGAYLADRETGEVRPQFLHGYPAALAIAQMSGLGHGGLSLLTSLASMLALWCVARRLWPRGPWPHLALAVYVLSPLTIWTARTPLSEGPTAALELGAALAAVVALQSGDSGRRALPWVGALLGALSFVRGNGWFLIPVVAAFALLRPPMPAHDRGAGVTGMTALVAPAALAVILGVLTSYPYVHDELRRMGLEAWVDVGATQPLILASAVAAVAALVVGLDRWLDRGGRTIRAAVARALGPRLVPWLIVGLVGVGIAAYFATRPPGGGPPFSRLDTATASLGWPLLGLALIGLILWIRMPAPSDGPGLRWTLALALVPAVTFALYARHAVPHATLYYYGRYLVPELLPAAILLALVPLESAVRRFGPHGWGLALGIAGAASIVAVPAYVHVTAPQTRLASFEGAGRIVDWLDDRIDPGAVIVAGGEGWHAAHTYNHVGGALELGRGHTLLRYHSREAAYATLHELLIDGPAARGEAPPPVYLLLNEATKTRASREHRKLEIGLDPGLYAPFVAERIDRVELYLYRLTPSRGVLPRRITRDALRLGLVRVGVVPDADRAVTRVPVTDFGEDASRCLEPDVPLRLDLERLELAKPGPLELVVQLTAPGVPATAQPSVFVDGELRSQAPPPGELSTRRETTLGPWLLSATPQWIELRAAERRGDGPCPWGAVHELRLLPLPAPRHAHPPGDTQRLEPDDDLGHPIAGARWVVARAVNRHRADTHPAPDVVGTGMVLEAGAAMRFSAVALPPVHGVDEDAPVSWTVVVTLLRSQPGRDARLELWIDDQIVHVFEPPAYAPGAWQSPPIELRRSDQRPASRSVEIELRLRGATQGRQVVVRDVAFFGPR